PERYLQATFDILEGTVETEVVGRMGAGYLSVADGVEIAGRVVPEGRIEPGCRIAAGARVGGRVLLGRDVSVGAGTTIERSVVLDGARIGANCTLRGCIVGSG